MTVFSRAPMRVDFAGGWTDVPEFALREGGAVVNAAISLYAHVEFLMGDKRIRLCAEDLNQRLSLATPADLVYDGTLDLHKAALNMLPVTGGIEILSRADAPGGSGLGASGALDVALVAGLAGCREESFTSIEIAELAYQLEAEELGLLGGRQDQYAAAIGGFLDLRFEGDEVAVRSIDVSSEAAGDLERHLLIIYTGHSHFSSATHERVWQGYARDADVAEALRTTRDLAEPAAKALAAGSWEELARIVKENWDQQQRLDATISTPRVRDIEEAVREAGAWGVKATGAGAGGCLLALVPAPSRGRVAEAAVKAGGQVLAAGFEAAGVRVWSEGDDPRRS